MDEIMMEMLMDEIMHQEKQKEFELAEMIEAVGITAIINNPYLYKGV